MTTKEHQIELGFIEKLKEIKYIYCYDVRARSLLEKFEELN